MQEGTKLLKLDICFKLPEDFDGNLNDAIQSLLDYRRGEKNHKDNWWPDQESNKTVYYNWCDMISQSDRVFYGEVALEEFKEEKWNEIPL